MYYILRSGEDGEGIEGVDKDVVVFALVFGSVGKMPLASICDTPIGGDRCGWDRLRCGPQSEVIDLFVVP